MSRILTVGLIAGITLAASPAGAATSEGKRGLLELGTPAPAFELPDVVSGATVSLDKFAGKDAVVVMFLCKHCPFVQHVQDGVAALAKEYVSRNVGFVGISANDAASHPEDGPESLKAQAQEAGFLFPYLYDESQDTARAYTAICTPDFFLFDRDRKLIYRGRFDASRPGSGQPVTGVDLRAALDAVLAPRDVAGLAGKSVPAKQKPSFGCSLKWKPGNEPAYSR